MTTHRIKYILFGGILSLFFVSLYQLSLSSTSSYITAITKQEKNFFITERNIANTTTITNSTAGIQNTYIYPSVLYGHVHMAKTGGTSLNGIFANRFERICGHKGYSYDAYEANEHAAREAAKNNQTWVMRTKSFNRDRVKPQIMTEIGFQDCDYISHEVGWKFWVDTFGESKFHGIPMELHVPCRDPIDHLMSQSNQRPKTRSFKQKVCDDGSSDSDIFLMVKSVLVFPDRYNRELENHFDVKCYDFKKQFTTYPEYMATKGKLQTRRIIHDSYIRRETNEPRNRKEECIWERQDIMEKVTEFLVENIAYYSFCNECMGSHNEITADISANVSANVSDT